MKILVINAGSSSIKYQLIDMETEQVIAKGMCDRIEQELGVTAATVVVTGGLGREIAAACRRKTVYDDRLLLDGLRLIYEKNRA